MVCWAYKQNEYNNADTGCRHFDYILITEGTASRHFELVM